MPDGIIYKTKSNKKTYEKGPNLTSLFVGSGGVFGIPI
jgi:FAD/FMN-containing dehydrogenase